MTEQIRPDVDVDLWLEQPAVAADRMHTAANLAEQFASTEAMLGFGMAAVLLLDRVAKFLPGPWGGLFEMITDGIKSNQQPTNVESQK